MEQLLGTARSRWPTLSLEKLGCPGETTDTFIDGGICGYDDGSQLDEAVAFLSSPVVRRVRDDRYRGERLPVPGGAVRSGGRRDYPGHPAHDPARLRAAAGPDIPIIGMSIYNPFLASWLLGPDGHVIAQASQTQLPGPVTACCAPCTRQRAIRSRTSKRPSRRTTSRRSSTCRVSARADQRCPDLRVDLGLRVTSALPEHHPNAAGYCVIARAYAEVLNL